MEQETVFAVAMLSAEIHESLIFSFVKRDKKKTPCLLRCCVKGDTQVSLMVADSDVVTENKS